MKLIKSNYYGIDHKYVNNIFEGDLTFVNDMCITDAYGNTITAAIYHSKNPDKTKGHKEFVGLHRVGTQFYIIGRTKAEIKKEAKHKGILCTLCKAVLVSVERHHTQSCHCKNRAFTDGGKDYLRAGAKDITKLKTVEVNLLTNKIRVIK